MLWFSEKALLYPKKPHMLINVTLEVSCYLLSPLRLSPLLFHFIGLNSRLGFRLPRSSCVHCLCPNTALVSIPTKWKSWSKCSLSPLLSLIINNLVTFHTWTLANTWEQVVSSFLVDLVSAMHFCISVHLFIFPYQPTTSLELSLKRFQPSFHYRSRAHDPQCVSISLLLFISFQVAISSIHLLPVFYISKENLNWTYLVGASKASCNPVVILKLRMTLSWTMWNHRLDVINAIKLRFTPRILLLVFLLQ